MTPKLIDRKYIVCPKCNEYEFRVDHLFDGKPHSFGPWSCETRMCRTEITGTVDVERNVEIELAASKEEPPGFALLMLGDLYLVVDEKYGRINHWDYFYHSHQCPTNLLHRVIDVFDAEGNDPHGRLRYVAGMDEAEDTRDKIEKAQSLREIFAMFKTDGVPPETEWPENNRGVLPFIAEAQREYRKERDPKA